MVWMSGNRRGQKKGEILAALDIGTSKIVCFIARRMDNHQPRIIGVGHHLAAGMKAGIITDMDAVEHALRHALEAAETMAGIRIEKVAVNISGNHIVSRTCQLELPIHGREVTQLDIERILSQSPDIANESHGDGLEHYPQEIIHTIPVSYSLDQQRGIRDPRGMVGHKLGTQLHVIAAGYGPVRTIGAVLSRLELEVEQMAVSAYASGLACLVEDEMDLGSVVVDMGAGTTTFAVFSDGQCVYTDGLSLGGAHVTNDIARGLTTSLHHAERLKTLYGHALPSAADEHSMIDVPLMGDEDDDLPNQVPLSHLTAIIRPRVEEIFELVRAKLRASAFDDVAGRRMILTGGASQLGGVREVAHRLMNKQVRLGKPVRFGRLNAPQHRTSEPSMSAEEQAAQSLPQHHNPATETGLSDITSGPGFATAAGLLAIAMQPSPTVPNLAAEFSGGSWLERAQAWLKYNL